MTPFQTNPLFRFLKEEGPTLRRVDGLGASWRKCRLMAGVSLGMSTLWLDLECVEDLDVFMCCFGLAVSLPLFHSLSLFLVSVLSSLSLSFSPLSLFLSSLSLSLLSLSFSLSVRLSLSRSLLLCLHVALSVSVFLSPSLFLSLRPLSLSLRPLSLSLSPSSLSLSLSVSVSLTFYARCLCVLLSSLFLSFSISILHCFLLPALSEVPRSCPAVSPFRDAKVASIRGSKTVPPLIQLTGLRFWMSQLEQLG